MLKLLGKIVLAGYNMGVLYLGLEYRKLVAELFVEYGNIYYQVYALVAIIIFVLCHGCMNILLNEFKEDLKEEKENN